ncbi:MAG TPA: hypothetical protein VIN04_11935 [Myxococcota bacterium]
MSGPARRATLALAALVLAALAVAWAAGWLEALERVLEARRTRAARQAVVAEIFAPVFESPEFQELARGRSDAEQQALLFELARDGLVRLPDELLLERLALLRDVAARADRRTCAMVLVGGSPGAAGDLVAALEPEPLRRWLVLSREAVLAALRDDPPRPLPPDEAERARAALLEALGPEDAARFEAALEALDRLSQEEACALARATLEAANRLPPEERRRVARLVASG